MGRPYSQDLRERVVDVAAATSRRQAAARFRVGVGTSIRWMTALTTTGAVTARPHMTKAINVHLQSCGLRGVPSQVRN